jgi:hypothetical protein
MDLRCVDVLMSAMGQKPTYALQQVMSALPPIATVKADMGSRWVTSSKSRSSDQCCFDLRPETHVAVGGVESADDGGALPSAPRAFAPAVRSRCRGAGQNQNGCCEQILNARRPTTSSPQAASCAKGAPYCLSYLLPAQLMTAKTNSLRSKPRKMGSYVRKLS